MEQYSPTIDFLLRVAWSSVSKMYNDKAKKYDFTMVSGLTLLSIDPKKGTPSTSLGPKMGVGATSLTRILKQLEEDKLIIKIPNKVDRRIVTVVLTENGKKYRDYCKEMVLKFNQSINELIPEEKMNIFKEVIETISRFADNNTLDLDLNHPN